MMHFHLTFLLLFPLAGAVSMICCLPMGGRPLPRRVGETIACGASAGAFVMAGLAMWTMGDEPFRKVFWQWMAGPEFSSEIAILYDPLAAVMALMVTFVAALIHIYSVPFMRQESDYLRYFFLLNLFVFCMLTIVLADDLLFLFLGWEGVGLCSYGLIGYWYRDPANCLAGRKAFLLTRIGDAALLIAIAIFFSHLGTLSLTAINQQAVDLAPGLITLAGLLLLFAAMAKSAQMPLQVWLPDAMAGPTPVSALIHAATMVTAGVYLLMRFLPLLSLSPGVMLAAALVGAVTALLGAAAALTQRDIKRLLAWSTISQVGFMFLGLGAGSLAGSMFHLLVHGFCKSLLFLGAGCIIRLLRDEHDIFRMGRSLRLRHPPLFAAFAIGVVALAGLPPGAGFFSKGEILAAVFYHPGPGYRLLWFMALLAALLTAFYAFRLLLLVFFGAPPPDADEKRDPVFEPLPALMPALLWPLALLALAGGLLNCPLAMPGGHWLSGYLGTAPAPPGGEGSISDWGLLGLDGLIALVGLGLAWFCHGPADRLGWRLAAAPESTAHAVLRNGYGLDSFYRLLVARPYQAMAGFLWKRVDEKLVDDSLTGAGRSLLTTGRLLGLWTTGRLTTALQSLLWGAAAIFGLLLLGIWRALP